MPYRASKNCSDCSAWPKLARQKCSKLEMTQAGPKKLPKTAQNCSKLLKVAQSCSKLFKFAQNCSKLFEMSQNVSKCLTMGQQVSKGVMCLNLQARKLSLLGIAVADYCCMGLRSMSIGPRSCLLLRSEPSIFSFTDRDHLSLDWLPLFPSTAYPEKIALLW